MAPATRCRCAEHERGTYKERFVNFIGKLSAKPIFPESFCRGKIFCSRVAPATRCRCAEHERGTYKERFVNYSGKRSAKSIFPESFCRGKIFCSRLRTFAWEITSCAIRISPYLFTANCPAFLATPVSVIRLLSWPVPINIISAQVPGFTSPSAPPKTPFHVQGFSGLRP